MIPNQTQADVPHSRDLFTCEDYPSTIIQRTEDYVVLNKPGYVRMYGEFDVTVEKLVWKWLGINDNLKWVHRLDYATSGVLCVGLSKRFATAACAAFEKRKTEKIYLAVVRGHIDINKIPFIKAKPTTILREKKEKVSTHHSESSDDSWQKQALEAGLSVHFAALQAEIEKDTSGDARLTSLSQKSYDDFRFNHKLRKQMRKVLKSRDAYVENPVPSIHTFFETPKDPSNPSAEAAEPQEKRALTGDIIGSSVDLHDTIVRAVDSSESPGEPPCAFRLAPPPVPFPTASSSSSSSSAPLASESPPADGSIYITAPVKKSHGEFRMQVFDGCSAPRAMTDREEEEEEEGGEEGWKACETRMEILGHGNYQGEPVTKVKLFPKSGRRHQLRLHCLVLGHPIVGDATYGPDDPANETAERMMLHALSLRIDLRKPPTASRKKYGDETSELFAETRDPFVLHGSTGELELLDTADQQTDGV